LLFFTLKALAWTMTPEEAVKVRMFPNAPEVAEFPLKVKVPGEQAAGG
jgi:hypothetical protein